MTQDSGFTDAAEPAPGPAYAGFKLLHESSSGFFRVFECNRSGRRVVVKALKENLDDYSGALAMLRGEYEISSSLYHPSIVQVMAMEDVPGIGPAIVMERVEGVTLESLLATGGCSRRLATEITRRLCDALSYMHSRGIVHRDLKPSNIMVNTAAPAVWIIDFNLSRSPEDDRRVAGCGTPGFMAPELAEGTLTPAADIYSLGMIMKLMLPRRFFGWHRVAGRCASPDPARRFSSAADVFPALRRTSRRLKTAAAVAVAVAAAATAFLLLFPTSTPRKETPAGLRPAKTKITEADTLPATAAPATGTAVTGQTEDSSADAATDTASGAMAAESTRIEDRIYTRSLQAAEKRFAQHLHALDTLHAQESANLAYVGHWRWLAQEDVRQWLGKEVNPDNPHFAVLMQLARRTIDDYSEKHDVEDNHAKKALFLRTGLGGTTGYSYRIGPDRICTRTLKEDGSWETVVKSTTPHTTSGDPMQ